MSLKAQMDLNRKIQVLAERVEKLEREIAVLKQKKGPGRPPKVSADELDKAVGG